MRNGFVHDRALLEPVEQCFAALGATSFREFPIRLGGRIGYADLWVSHGSKRYLIEAENKNRRVDRDLAKARAAEADLLAIIAPSWKVARQIRRRLQQLKVGMPPDAMEVRVFTIGAAIRWVNTLPPSVEGTPRRKFDPCAS